MSPHEEDRLIEKLTTVIDERLATRPIRFCAEHEALKKRTWWGSLKFLGTIATVLGTCAAAVWWVSLKSSEAAETATVAVATLQAGYVDRGTYTNGQDAQDRVTTLELGHIKSNMVEVKTTVAELQRGQAAQLQVLSRIAGKLDVKDAP